MRGLLSIASARAPYRRAGLAWATREPQKVAIRDLDGQRFKALLDDPVLSIKIGDLDGTFVHMPDLKGLDIDRLQMLIDSAPEVESPAPGAPIASTVEALNGAEGELEQVRVDLDKTREQLAGAEDCIKARDHDIVDLREQLKKSAEAVSASEAAAAEARTKLTEAEAEIAKLKKLKLPKPAPNAG
jgi:hypothetical protein